MNMEKVPLSLRIIDLQLTEHQLNLNYCPFPFVLITLTASSFSLSRGSVYLCLLS